MMDHIGAMENLKRPPHLPKVVWNNRTKLFVLWFHLNSDQCCTYRFVGVATSPSANGTFTVIDAFQPDGISSLDMTLFEDKKNGEVHGVYLVRSCGNSYVGIWMKII